MSTPSSTVPVTLSVNGKPYTREVEPRTLLVHLIRDSLGLTGTHVGCDTSSCGACTVMLGGLAVKSCTLLAVQADESEVQTVEGLANGDGLHPLQEGFWEEHGLQWRLLHARLSDDRRAAFGAQPQPVPRTRYARGWRVTTAAARATTTSSKRCSTRRIRCRRHRSRQSRRTRQVER